jgi:hypothetical protein
MSADLFTPHGTMTKAELRPLRRRKWSLGSQRRSLATGTGA